MYRDRHCASFVTASYLLDSDLLTELQAKFPWLSNWNPDDVGSVNIKLPDCEHALGLQEIVDENADVAEGVVEVWTSDGAADPVLLSLNPGHYDIGTLAPEGTQFFLLKCLNIALGGPGQVTWMILGKKDLVYPLTEPTTSEEIANMMARECGYTIA